MSQVIGSSGRMSHLDRAFHGSQSVVGSALPSIHANREPGVRMRIPGRVLLIVLLCLVVCLLGGVSNRNPVSATQATPAATSEAGLAEEGSFSAANVVLHLPWENGSIWKINYDQTAGNHNDIYNEYAFDAVPDPFGRGSSNVAAAAAGTVVVIVDDVMGQGGKLSGNCVMIKHAEGIYSLYAHLEHGTIAQAVRNSYQTGTPIPSGTILARYGGTGNATGPHLHWSLTSNAFNTAGGGCSGYSIPSSFVDPDAELQQDGGVPRSGRYYLSFNQAGPSCSSQPLQITQGLSVIGERTVGQSLTATFSIVNTNPGGCSATTINNFGAGGRGPGGDADIQDFPLVPSLTLSPGQTYNYSASRSFSKPGNYGWFIYGEGASLGNPGGHTTSVAFPLANVSYPPGTRNPSFSGAKLPITNCVSSPSSGAACRVRDGSSTTNWSVHGTPSTAVLTLDLGSVKSLTGIKWQFTYTGYADQFEVLTSTSYSGATTSLGTFGNGSASRTWFGKGTTVSARFVQFVFRNPLGDPALGSVAEIQVWGKPPTVTNPPGTTNPTMVGTKLPVSNAFDSANTGTARRVLDGASWTNFRSPGGATTITLTLDLGAVTPLSGVRWSWSSIGYGDQFQVRVSSSYGGSYTSLGTFGNGTSTGTWFGVSTNTSGRFVQFVFTNPNVDPALGALGEVQIWKRPSKVNPPGTANPSVSGLGEHTFTNIFSSPASSSARNVADGKSWTNWASPATTPSSATLTLDLGSVKKVKVLRWQMPNVGYADQFQVRVATTYGSWTTLGTFGNPGAKSTWYGINLASSRSVRYVQVVFTNPNADPALGAIGEFEGWGPSGTVISAASTSTGQSDPDLAGAPLPLTCDATPATSNPLHTADKACDRDGGTEWHTNASSPSSTTLTVSIGDPTEVSGIKWNFAQKGNAEQFTVGIGNGATVTLLGTWAGGAAGAYEGIPVPPGTVADRVIFTFTNINGDETLGHVAEVEVWGPALGSLATPAASPVPATPEISPITATPEPETTKPDASPVPATPEPTETQAPDATPTHTEASPEPVTEETPAPTDEATEAPTEIPATPIVTDEPAPTEDSTQEPTATEAIAPTQEPAAEPTAPVMQITLGTITGTNGDLVNCRAAPVDGDPIIQLAEGDRIELTGPAIDGWYPVLCEGHPGFVSEAFVTIGAVDPTETVMEPTATGEDDADPEPTEPTDEDNAAPTAEPTLEPTAEPTLDPTAEPDVVPYDIVDTGDTEDSGTAWYASDDDPATAWRVVPSQNPQQTRLYLDLGAVLPIDRVTLELAWPGGLPYFELWLSEDGETWYNATPEGINGWSLWAGEAHRFDLGYDARYLRLVIPNVDESGLSEVGGIAEIAVWPGDITQTSYLTALGEPTTPTPAPEPTAEPTLEPTEEVVVEPTEEVIEEPTAEWVEPTEAWVEPTAEWVEPTVEKLPVEGGEEMPPEEEAAG